MKPLSLLLTEYYSNHNDSNDAHHDHHLDKKNKDIYYHGPSL